MYEVRLSVKPEHMEVLQFVDFTEVDRGIIRLKAPYDSHSFTDVNKRIGIMYPIKIETFFNGRESVGMVFLHKNVNIKSGGNMELRKYGIKEPIRGTIDYFNPHFILTDKCEYLKSGFKKGDDCLFIRFITRHYHKLLMDKDIEGVLSESINIKVFIGNKFKPHSDDQLIATGYEIIDKEYSRKSEFYDLDFISFEENNLDKDGNDLSKPLYKTITSFKDVRYFK